MSALMYHPPRTKKKRQEKKKPCQENVRFGVVQHAALLNAKVIPIQLILSAAEAAAEAAQRRKGCWVIALNYKTIRFNLQHVAQGCHLNALPAQFLCGLLQRLETTVQCLSAVPLEC
jgi:hypothetical protein